MARIDQRSDPPPAPGRRERRKQETRRRLLAAARELVAEGGVEALRLADVTERADVGFGTVYTYFASKEDLVEAVVEHAVAAAARAIGSRALETDDPAVAAALSYRSFVRYARESPDVVSVLVHLGDGEELFERALLPWARETLERGARAERFVIDDVDLAVTSISAAAFAVIRGVLAGRLGEEAGVDGAAMMLRSLGLGVHEAAAIARAPVPEIVVPDDPR